VFGDPSGQPYLARTTVRPLSCARLSIGSVLGFLCWKLFRYVSVGSEAVGLSDRTVRPDCTITRKRVPAPSILSVSCRNVQVVKFYQRRATERERKTFHLASINVTRRGTCPYCPYSPCALPTPFPLLPLQHLQPLFPSL
jgi:hypothetical protein